MATKIPSIISDWARSISERNPKKQVKKKRSTLRKSNIKYNRKKTRGRKIKSKKRHVTFKL